MDKAQRMMLMVHKQCQQVDLYPTQKNLLLSLVYQNNHLMENFFL
jgi:hypothetical protein